MSRETQEIKFTGGLSLDTNYKDIQPGDYPFMVGMRNTKTTDGEWGAVTNIKGNVLIQYQLPAGENECIGTLEDKEAGLLEYWVYNSNGNHRILQYDPSTNTINEIIKGIHLNLKKEWRVNQPSITDRRFMIWSDAIESNGTIEGNPQRYLDKPRAILFDKKVQFDILVSSLLFNRNGTRYYIKIYKDDVAVLTQTLIQTNAGNNENKKDLYEKLMNAINNNAQVAHYVTADDCGGCKLEIDFKLVGDYWVEITSDRDTFFNLPTNRYHRNWDELNINYGKRPPLFSPRVDVMIDESFNFNFIQGKFFQFAYRYVYWDSQKTTLSPYSPIAAQPLKCSDTESPYNLIRVNFTDDILNTEKDLCDIKYVEIIVREGNTGAFKSVKKIDVCDLTFPTQYFDFRNDGSYPVIQEDSKKPYEYLPLKSIAHAIVDDRAYLGNTLENYNNLDCVEGKVNVAYETIEECKEEFVTIKGKIRIVNELEYGDDIFNLINRWTFLWQPIWSKTGDKFYYGSVGNLELALDKPDENKADINKQEIPLGGFVVYLAGTSNYAISVQNPIVATVPGSTTNVYLIDSLHDTNVWRDAAKNESYSTFEIKNVPKGKKFILRIASNLVSPDDRYGAIHNINNGVEWQKTSSYLKRINGQEVTEIEVDTDVIGDEVNIPGFFEIMDLCPSKDHSTTGVACYVLDAITDHIGTISKIRIGTTMEMVNCKIKGSVSAHTGSPLLRTDHNGFFFYQQNNFLNTQVKDVLFTCDGAKVRDYDKAVYKGMYQDLFEGALTSVTKVRGIVSKGMDFYIVYNRSEQVTSCKRTFIKGRVTTDDSYADGVQGISVVATNSGRVIKTRIDGTYEYMVYSSSNFIKREGNIYLSYKDDCCPKITVNSYHFRIPKIMCSGRYSPSVKYIIADILVHMNTQRNGIWKHRNNVHLGFQYYDEYGRSLKVQTSDELKLYIPFWTESNGNKGLPIISWEVNHRPPPEAVMYQVVRILNPLYNKWLQYFVSEVKYVKTYGETITETTYEAGDATEVYFSLQSLVDYGNENSGSVLSWEFTKEDRITLMKDADGNWFDTYLDFRIENDRLDKVFNSTLLAISNTGTLPKLSKGVTVELWNPKSIVTEEIYHEISECFKIKDGFHLAGFKGQDQTATQPATGTLRYGDAYFTNRLMPIVTYNAPISPNPPTVNEKFYRRTFFETEYMVENTADSRVQSIGRIDIEDKDYKQTVFLNRVRFSGRYIPETNINELNVFAYFGYIKDNLGSEIDRIFGGVMYLGYAGNVLLAVNKFKCVPIYINSTQVFSVDGTGETLTKSSRIANLGLPIKEERGTQNPESVIIENGELYAWDASKGKYWRYEYSGLFDVSDYEAITYFSNLSKLGASKMIVGYDRENEELNVSNKKTNETISFNSKFRGEQRKNRWMTFYEYPFLPESYGTVNKTFVSFVKGQLWVHNKNEKRNNFFGVQTQYGVDVICNILPKAKKLFWNIRQVVNSLFTTPKKGIEVYGANGDEIQYSQLNEFHFKKEEGDWRADFLRDVTDKNFADITNPLERETTALLRGELLRGNVAKIKLRNSDEKEVILYAIDITVSDSQTTNK